MSEAVSIDGILTRIEAALDQLGTTIDRRVDVDRAITSLEEELERVGADRQRLAQAVDQASDRAVRLDDANREVSKRLIGAMEAIRSVLEPRSG
jgi:ABC-type transporter Mla subunit MlaD